MRYLLHTVLAVFSGILTPYAQSVNNALQFDGGNDYVSINSVAAPLATSIDFTIEFWMKTDYHLNTSAVRTNFLAINPVPPVDNKFSIAMGSFVPSAQTGKLMIYEASGPVTSINSSTIVGDNQCHYIAYVRRGNMGEAFVDGVSIGTIPVGAPLAPSDRVSIGQEWDLTVPSDFYNGMIDELTFWNMARTPTQIAADSYTKFSGSEPGIIAHYNFDRGTGSGNNTGLTTLDDRSPNGHDGTLVNFALTGSSSNWINLSRLDLGNDTSLCPGGTITLNATQTNATYEWQDLSSGTTYTVTQPGTYWVKAIGCGVISDSITIGSHAYKLNLGSNTSLCPGDTLLLNTGLANMTYLWQDQSSGSTYTVTQPGMYWVQVNTICGPITDSISIGSKECKVDSLPLFEMPNIFTPDNDGTNDFFCAKEISGIKEASLVIYNRWGQQLIETTNLWKGWDGKYKGDSCPDGVYFWIVRYSSYQNDSKELSGFLTLMR